MARGQAGSRKYMERVAAKMFSESLLFKQVEELEMLQKATDEKSRQRILSFSESEGEEGKIIIISITETIIVSFSG